MIPAPGSSTRLLALLGDPVAHSLSPRFQNAALAARGLDAVYLALRCTAAELPGLLRGIALAGGGGNVTLPHKELAAASVDRLTQAARLAGACNTFWGEAGEVWGDNTDVEGARAALLALLGRPLQGGRALLLGAGGAARAAALALAAAGAGEVVLLNRTPARAQALRQALAEAVPGLRVAADAAEAGSEPFALAVNATTLGLGAGDPPPLPEALAGRVAAGLDLVYTPRGTTRWVRELRRRGLPAADGREMLLQQGAAAFRHWWPGEPPLAPMRAALLAADE